MSRQEKRANERRRNKILHKITLAAGEGVGRAVAFTFALATNAFAAEPKKEEEFTLPQVTVTDKTNPYVVPNLGLQRLPEPVQRIPQSITIVPQQIIQEQSATTLRDALRNVTGIGIAAGEGGGAQGDNFTLRGFNARNDMYLDGVRDQGTYFRDTFNIESVEVLKGPASIYFGRGSTGGIINQVSKAPRLEGFYDGTASAGSGPFFRGTADINQPLSPTIALRVNAMAHGADIVDRDHVKVSRQGFAPTLTLGLGTPTQMSFGYFFQHENNISDQGFPFFHGKPVRVSRGTWYGLTDDDYERTMTNMGTISLNHRFSEDLNLRSAFRFSNVRRHTDPSIPQTICVAPTTCGPGAIITGVNRSRPQRNTAESIWDSQTDLTARFNTWGFGHTLSSGIELSWDRLDTVRYASAGPATTLNDPNNGQSSNPKTIAANTLTVAPSFGIYAADQIALHEWFDLIGGLRWDYFNADQENRIPGGLSFDATDKMLSYRGGLVFHPTPQQSYYFSYATAFNPSAEGLVLAANNQSTPSEKNEIFEIGTKFLLMGGQLTLQGALFSIEKTNARTNDPILGVQVLDGKQRSRGVELGAAGRVLPGWNVFTGFTYLDAKILKSNDTQVVEGVTYSLQGKVPQNVPKYSATLWTTYDFLDKWQIGGGPTYVGSRFANNSNANEVPGYVRWDATVAYNISEKIQCRLNAQNFTNSAFIESVHPSHVVPGAGRTFIASTFFRFNIGKAMIVHIPNVLSQEQITHCREVMSRATWVDGRVTAGYQSSVVKHNRQLAETSPEARELGDMVVAALERNPLFITAALPLRVFPPLFNRYEGGETFGSHLDNSIRQIPGTPYRIRTDVSATLFLSAPEEYDDGELVIDDIYGAHSAKLPAGDMIVYPANSLHHVNAVTRGVLLASFFWVQSMVRDDGQRTLLFDLDMSINQINQALPNHPSVVGLTNCYHNLLRRFAEV